MEISVLNNVSYRLNAILSQISKFFTESEKTILKFVWNPWIITAIEKNVKDTKICDFKIYEIL